MSSQNLSITQAGAVARITLTQPEIRNAFSDEVIAEITAAFVDVGSRADVRAVVLAAEGPAFCAGANLNWMRRMADYTRDENIADAGKLAEMLRVIYECPKPTIARVQGDVYAGGMGLVAACDMAVAVDTPSYMRKMPNFVSSMGALRVAARPSASTRRVSAGSITPSSHRRAVA